MTSSPITVVTGPPGVGKTTWIGQQLNQRPDWEAAVYFAAGVGSLPLDGVRLGLEFPQLRVLTEGQEEELLAEIQKGIPVWVEVAFHVDPVQLQQQLGQFDCYWVGLTADAEQDVQSYLWADELVVGQTSLPPLKACQLWRADLTGQVWDPASLEVFWAELLLGAYGEIYRAKGIFEMPEGEAIYGEFTAGSQRTSVEDFEVLNLPRHLQGRPQRLSGLEIVGSNLDQASLRQTVQDCCLSDAALRHYQQQIQELIEAGEEVA